MLIEIDQAPSLTIIVMNRTRAFIKHPIGSVVLGSLEFHLRTILLLEQPKQSLPRVVHFQFFYFEKYHMCALRVFFPN